METGDDGELSEKSRGLYRLLLNAQIYAGSMALIRKPAAKHAWVRDFVRPRPQMRVLDVGSGTSSILAQLDRVRYVGIDPNGDYIEKARSRFGSRGDFRVGTIADIPEVPGQFEVILALGLLHHLDDSEVRDFLEHAYKKLPAGGRLVTLDGGFVPNQSRASRFVVSRDRGGHVREMSRYADFAIAQGFDTRTFYTNSFLRIPYSHVTLICHKPKYGGGT